MSVRVLCKTKWVSLRGMKTELTGDNEYYYLHEDMCKGKKVAILPYRYFNDRVQYLLRNEVTPPWGIPPKQFVSSITGGVEKDDVLGTAVLEVGEESGYEVTR